MYIEKVIPWKSKNWVAPPPSEIARIRKEAGTHDALDAENGDVPVGTNGVNNGDLHEHGEEEKKEDTVV